MIIDFLRYPEGYTEGPYKNETAYGVYVLSGQYETEGEVYGPGTFIWYPADFVSVHGAAKQESAKLFLISSGVYNPEYLPEKQEFHNRTEKKVVDVNCMPWFYRATSTNGKFFGKKAVLLDEATGVQINYMNYPAGFTTYKHRHPAGHGFFVFSGQLQSGDHLYGPGTFIWYPEGYITDHGATAYEDLICLQISNKSFSIEYVK